MSQTDAETTDQCRALTSDGDRCQHSASDGTFCHQHDESDPTVDSDDETAERDDDSEGPSETDDSSTDGDSTGGDEADAISEVAPLVEIRRKAESVAAELIERPLDGVVEVYADDDGWIAVVEVVERRAVPDTQDILGCYELTFDGDGTVTGYRRRSRYRRLDTDRQEGFE
ncbi:gas vesicle protein GvpO, halophile-type [Haloarcula salina]|uniref:Gas vesicle protein n=1 Tax=Haloarcula salina TaxID=1429914 RepID=A0AA41KIS2_9EURY|nr:gas vesicle protein GvpO [Haloarcula salina]MBV0901943.1 gas vesicle protein [Haloarcula salina]